MKSNKELNTDWRKVASTIYKKPIDSKIYGEVELDVTELEKFISEKRKEGLKITLTHIFVLILARGLKTVVPELNVYIRRGKVVQRPSIDGVVSVLKANGDMSSIKIPDTDKMSLKDLQEVMQDEIQKSRKGDENTSMQSKNFLAKLPWPIRNWFFKVYTILTVHWGLSVPFLGVSANSFGSYLVTNIGSIGLEKGYPALLPSSNLAFVFVMGGVKKKPVVVNDEIVIRRMINITAVMDHRIVDASHGGRMFRFIRQLMQHPEELLQRVFV
ncbi:MAG: 2-oxo acid dehydrogenase subunit E2 [Bacteroidales bacterium]|nr:2-oxo acid dehydrogenase subunit E2 [Bacteroidales bacterium]MBN2818930.1 2-oxo acid dehydrogenase subunit E2 [Bacteroidales bacterium]